MVCMSHRGTGSAQSRFDRRFLQYCRGARGGGANAVNPIGSLGRTVEMDQAARSGAAQQEVER